AVHLGPSVATPLDAVVLLVAGRAAGEPGAVVQQHVQAGDVVADLAGALGGGTAGVVADHAAERAVHVGGRLRAESQPVRFQCVVELVQHDAGLDDASAALHVDRDDVVAVLGPVDHHGRVGALPGQAGAAPA